MSTPGAVDGTSGSDSRQNAYDIAQAFISNPARIEEGGEAKGPKKTLEWGGTKFSKEVRVDGELTTIEIHISKNELSRLKNSGQDALSDRLVDTAIKVISALRDAKDLDQNTDSIKLSGKSVRMFSGTTKIKTLTQSDSITSTSTLDNLMSKISDFKGLKASLKTIGKDYVDTMFYARHGRNFYHEEGHVEHQKAHLYHDLDPHDHS